MASWGLFLRGQHCPLVSRALAVTLPLLAFRSLLPHLALSCLSILGLSTDKKIDMHIFFEFLVR